VALQDQGSYKAPTTKQQCESIAASKKTLQVDQFRMQLLLKKINVELFQGIGPSEKNFMWNSVGRSFFKKCSKVD